MRGMGAFKFDHQPLFAPGWRYVTLWDLKRICVDPFERSASRAKLFWKLEEFVQRFLLAGIPCEMVINGSFLTEKVDPSDIDVAVNLDLDVADNLNDEQFALTNEVNSENFIDGIDSFVETVFPLGHPLHGAEGYDRPWSEEWGREHNGEYLKGVAVLRLGETDVGLRIRR